MKTYYGYQACDHSYPMSVVLVIGNFDGVHLGHQKTIRQAQDYAKQKSLPLAVLTFDPHPVRVLRPGAVFQALTSPTEKRLLLDQLGVDVCVQEAFTPEFAEHSAEYFVSEYLIGALHAKAVFVGQDFRFGREREGDLSFLKKLAEQKGTEVFGIVPQAEHGEVISSSRIRRELANKNIRTANQMLSRPFFVRGEVVHGDKRGRTIGFPTANLDCSAMFPVGPGVYRTETVYRDRSYPSVTNIGRRPTFVHPDSTALRIETHLIGIRDIQLYGEWIEVRFLDHIRDERKFSGIDELKAQIEADCRFARNMED